MSTLNDRVPLPDGDDTDTQEVGVSPWLPLVPYADTYKTLVGIVDLKSVVFIESGRTLKYYRPEKFGTSDPRKREEHTVSLVFAHDQMSKYKRSIYPLQVVHVELQDGQGQFQYTFGPYGSCAVEGCSKPASRIWLETHHGPESRGQQLLDMRFTCENLEHTVPGMWPAYRCAGRPGQGGSKKDISNLCLQLGTSGPECKDRVCRCWMHDRHKTWTASRGVGTLLWSMDEAQLLNLQGKMREINSECSSKRARTDTSDELAHPPFKKARDDHEDESLFLRDSDDEEVGAWSEQDCREPGVICWPLFADPGSDNIPPGNLKSAAETRAFIEGGTSHLYDPEAYAQSHPEKRREHTVKLRFADQQLTSCKNSVYPLEIVRVTLEDGKKQDQHTYGPYGTCAVQSCDEPATEIWLDTEHYSGTQLPQILDIGLTCGHALPGMSPAYRCAGRAGKGHAPKTVANTCLQLGMSDPKGRRRQCYCEWHDGEWQSKESMLSFGIAECLWLKTEQELVKLSESLQV